MKHRWWIPLLLLPALLVGGGCEDQAAMQAQARREKAAKEEYKAAYDSCLATYNSALAKERAQVLGEAQILYGQAANTASQYASQPGEFKLKFTNIQNDSLVAVERVKQAIATAEKAAAAKADEDKRKAEAAKLEEEKKKADAAKAAQAAPPTAGVASTMANVGDVTGKPATPAGAAPKAGEDDDALDAPKAGAAGAATAAGNGPKVPSDPFTPFDDKATFKCYLVKSAKKYAIAYCVIKNNTTKELRVVRPLADFATEKGDKTWPVVAMFDYKTFKAENWDNLDADNPDAFGNERISLAPGDACKVIMMTEKAERDGEYSKAVKLVGKILWNDSSESIVVNNN